MSGSRSRDKGARFEREVAELLREVWPDAQRGLGQARGGGEAADVVSTPPYFIQCKHEVRGVNVHAAFVQAERDEIAHHAIRLGTPRQTPLVVSKVDRGPILVTMALGAFQQLEVDARRGERIVRAAGAA